VIVLATGIDEHQIAFRDRAAILDVMQDRRVVAGTDDRRVTGTAATAATERKIDQRFELALEHRRASPSSSRADALRSRSRRLAQRASSSGACATAARECFAVIDHRARRSLAFLLGLAEMRDRASDQLVGLFIEAERVMELFRIGEQLPQLAR